MAEVIEARQYKTSLAQRVAMKRYQQENLEKYVGYTKKWKDANKDKLREFIECPCGKKIRGWCIYAHRKTKKHMRFIENQRINQV